jgi:ketosteroid isomerase-like protein
VTELTARDSIWPVPIGLLLMIFAAAAPKAEPFAWTPDPAQQRQAAQKGDVDRLYQFVLELDKGPIIENGKLRRSRNEAIEMTRNAFVRIKSVTYTYDQEHITVLSPTTALWVADGQATATLDDGQQVQSPFAETIIFVASEGQWKVLHAHRSQPPRQR